LEFASIREGQKLLTAKIAKNRREDRKKIDAALLGDLSG
jgi:hypothetical protein